MVTNGSVETTQALMKAADVVVASPWSCRAALHQIRFSVINSNHEVGGFKAGSMILARSAGLGDGMKSRTGLKPCAQTAKTGLFAACLSAETTPIREIGAHVR
jgi:hypothetical protein